MFVFLSFLLTFKNANAGDWKKKDVRDYTDADLERLFEQWEVILIVILIENASSRV